MTASGGNRSAGGSLMAALFAVWALLLQTATPTPAIAADPLSGVAICTQMGVLAADTGASHAPPPLSAQCKAHCLAAALAAVTTPVTPAVSAPLTWAQAI